MLLCILHPKKVIAHNIKLTWALIESHSITHLRICFRPEGSLLASCPLCMYNYTPYEEKMKHITLGSHENNFELVNIFKTYNADTKAYTALDIIH